MWEMPVGLPAAAGHVPVTMFSDGGHEPGPARTPYSLWAYPGCRCGWVGESPARIPLPVPATEGVAGNRDQVEAAVGELAVGLRSRWWREHLVVVAPAADLAAAMPGLRLDDPGLADAVASAWVDGASWAEVGAAVGIARQAAWKRWRHTVVSHGRSRGLAVAADGRPRRRELPAPGGWPGQPGWVHPCPELVDEHSPVSYSVTLAGRERVGVTTSAAYAGPGCRCGWRGPVLEVPEVPRAELGAALGALAVRVFAPAWNTHFHQAVPTARIRSRLGPTRDDADDLDRLVDQARARGASWAAIGAAVGMSAQGAWDRWSTLSTAPASSAPARRHRRRSPTMMLRSQSRR